MESLKVTISYWPQVLVAAFLLAAAIRGIVMNGKPIDDPIIRAHQAIWLGLWFALVLGMGGFWGHS